MRWLIGVMLAGAIIAPAWSQSSSSSSTHRRAAKRKRTARSSGPSYQLHPEPERYQEIQKALAERGYFKGEVNGQWGDDSIDALKRFQADQKLPDDGKIDSPSLISLGLGPKHDANSAAASKAESPPP